MNWTTRFSGPGPLDVYFGELGDDRLADAEEVFFGRLQTSNGTFKTTWLRRLDDVSEMVSELLPRGRRLRIMDVAVSSGVTAAEWSHHLQINGVDHDLTAGDLAINGVLMTAGRRSALLWEDDGNPLAAQLGHQCLYFHRFGRLGFLTRSLDALLAALYRLVSRRPMSPYESPPVAWRLRVRRVGLISRRLSDEFAAQIVLDDISVPGRFVRELDVCRAANVLNRSYFSDDDIRKMARNLLARIRDGGLLVACRTCDEEGRRVNRASVLRKVRGDVEVVGRLNGGIDTEAALIDAARSRSPYVVAR